MVGTLCLCGSSVLRGETRPEPRYLENQCYERLRISLQTWKVPRAVVKINRQSDKTRTEQWFSECQQLLMRHRGDTQDRRECDLSTGGRSSERSVHTGGRRGSCRIWGLCRGDKKLAPGARPPGTTEAVAGDAAELALNRHVDFSSSKVFAMMRTLAHPLVLDVRNRPSLAVRLASPYQDMEDRPNSSASGTGSSRSNNDNQVCWDIETYKLVTKRVEDLESENRMLRGKVVVMAAENAALRERLETEVNSRSLSELLEQLRASAPPEAPPTAPPPTAPFIPCDYDHVFRMSPTEEQMQPSPSQWTTSSTQTSRPLAHLEADEPKFWDIQSVISGSLVGDRIISKFHPKFPLLDENSSFQPWTGSPLGTRLNEHGAYLAMPFPDQRVFPEETATGAFPNGGELAENLLRRRTRRRGRRGGKKHGGRRKKQEGNSPTESPYNCTM
eukprot:Gregarina_sp_Poly_1__222@NODE_1052_length_5230_cov_141_654271_g732_i0_p1_GENE_NODE_1052_length_5230_cov_141_654271_g732_i0NODE_1052_length_5230_cov_141_654271_g732_i0_p1_ORF_typecomplete_len444_score70_45TTKRSYEDQ/PF10212_9/7_1e03TTKRSYEDQ/PF10212_9/0_0067HOOK/PF05622_12/0_034HAP1_N/PF04849_13/0_094ZapB/PF06005_12/0_2TolA_bind_tri/PF16331_5/1_2TolA_bind_tri/PF16331_5/83TSC22/PF01166_18/3_3_NODE_1052_length_5230_cov_141_654271_g732_i037555086